MVYLVNFECWICKPCCSLCRYERFVSALREASLDVIVKLKSIALKVSVPLVFDLYGLCKLDHIHGFYHFSSAKVIN